MLKINVFLVSSIIALAMVPFTVHASSSQETPAAQLMVCSKIYAPVCGNLDGVKQIYSNQCMAEAAGAQVLNTGDTCHASPIQEPPTALLMVCSKIYAPVCGNLDGVKQIYSNQCMAEAAGAQVLNTGDICEK